MLECIKKYFKFIYLFEKYVYIGTEIVQSFYSVRYTKSNFFANFNANCKFQNWTKKTESKDS